MTKDELKLALDKAFDLGSKYWQQADSEYSSQWKKADATRAQLDQLIEDTAKQARSAPVQPVALMSDEQDAFEKVFKLPDGITRFDGGYAPTSYSAWSAQQNCYRWEGWKARSKLYTTLPAAQPAPVPLTDVPLTDVQITAICKQVAEGGPEDSIDRFVRAIEAAHGITPAPEKGQP
jgi:hypothetical protein